MNWGFGSWIGFGDMGWGIWDLAEVRGRKIWDEKKGFRIENCEFGRLMFC